MFDKNRRYALLCVSKAMRLYVISGIADICLEFYLKNNNI